MIRIIAAKELRSLFSSPLAWILLASLQIILAWIFLMRLDSFLELQPTLTSLANAPGVTEIIIAPVCSALGVVLLMTTPLLSMRSIAEERRNRTLTLLISSPLSMTEIVLGKFLGLIGFLLIPIGMVSLMGLSLQIGAELDFGFAAANVIGLVLLTGSFAAVGLYASSLTAQPMVAAVIALALLLASWLASLANPDPNSLIQLLSVTRRFENFNNGLFDSADLVWHLLAIALFLALTIRRLDRDRLIGQVA